MPNRTNPQRDRIAFSASAVLDTIGTALTTIRIEDKLTFADMAAVLGKSEDQAAKYCAGSAAMDVVTYARARREWNGRLDGALDRLCHDSRPTSDADRHRHSKVLKAALALSIALEDDDEITPHEVRANRGTIEQARDALDELLRKMPAPRAVQS
jgi:transcriptional regulator with XRE-family HTH domain